MPEKLEENYDRMVDGYIIELTLDVLHFSSFSSFVTTLVVYTNTHIILFVADGSHSVVIYS